MGPKKSELLILILQFLDDEKFIKTARMLEKESACYFNMKYFEDQVLAGEWDEVERYLSGFTKVEDNSYSMKTFFEIRKHKYVEALDRKDRTKAVEILYNDLQVFNDHDQDTYKELIQLIHLENIREHENFSTYGNTTFAQKNLLLKLRELIESNPQVHNKLAFPALPAFRLKYLIDQSLKWQHKLCKCGRPNPDMKTLFVDHVCGPQTPTNNSLVGAISKGASFLPMVTPAPFQDGTAPSFDNSLSLTGWMKNPNPPMPHPVVAAGTVNFIPPQNAGLRKRHRSLPEIYTGTYSHCVYSKQFVKCSHIDSADEVTYTRPTDPPSMHSQDDLPMKVARSLNQGSKVISMDFHPKEHTILLVGTSSGGIGIWDAGSGEKLAQTTFRIWNVSNCPLKMQAALPGDELAVSVNRCIWNLDGEKIGVAFSKSIAHIYSYSGAGELRPHLEINAHIGGVNDIAFGCNNKQLSIITCGDDTSIKVWDAVTGHRKYIFEGHEVPVYCIFPHQKENVQFIFSVDIDGKIKLWAYNHKGSIEEHDAPGKCRIATCYSSDGLRILSCGTNKEGESYVVEWNRKDGTLKRTYSGLQKRSFGMVQFDTTRNRFLAAGDDSQIKFWDMDNVNILTTTDVEEGCLEAIPCLRFNKEGSLLAVTTKENGIKILANSDGLHLLHILKNGSFKGTRVLPEALVTKNSADNNQPVDVKQRLQDEDVNKIKTWKLAEVSHSVQWRSLRLPGPMSTGKIVQLLYTNSGSDVLALDSDAVHKLWLWTRNECNPTGKATTFLSPKWRQKVIAHDSSYRDPKKEISCMILTKTDSYLLSTSGVSVSFLIPKTLKTLQTFLNPSPAATSFAFHPEDNNIIAFGLENSEIRVQYKKLGEKRVLEGHQQKITGLAFSQALNVLISSGADAQLCAWSMDGWKKQREKYVYPQEGWLPSPIEVTTKIQFHKDQVQLLVVQESQISIFDASTLERVCHWKPKDSMAAPIASATYSCDSQLVYVSFCDGAVGIFDADVLRPCWHFPPLAFLPPGMRNDNVYALTIAAHPLKPNQFAIGLTDGGVYLIEPTESEGKSGVGSMEKESH